MANHKKERIETAQKYLYIINTKLSDAKYTDDYKGMILYLNDGLVFKLEITEDKKDDT